MGRTLKVHVRKDGKWEPIGEIHMPTPVYDTLRLYAAADVAMSDMIVAMVKRDEPKETPDGE